MFLKLTTADNVWDDVSGYHWVEGDIMLVNPDRVATMQPMLLELPVDPKGSGPRPCTRINFSNEDSVIVVHDLNTLSEVMGAEVYTVPKCQAPPLQAQPKEAE